MNTIKHIKTITTNTLTGRIHYDTDVNEYIVSIYSDDADYSDADYYTDDRQDAIDTLIAMFHRLGDKLDAITIDLLTK